MLVSDAGAVAAFDEDAQAVAVVSGACGVGELGGGPVRPGAGGQLGGGEEVERAQASPRVRASVTKAAWIRPTSSRSRSVFQV
ncbi:hypothetical protein [Kitasatospora sp. NPDC005856]|uniref:hypothetical protein n=1 Tax=Kitasatospora sp. NPDC005856 TaxID=3154566 RepID=UPI0033D6675B